MGVRLLVAAVSALVVTGVQAQDWPTRPVTLVLPYAAGGPVDVVGRIMAPRMSELLGRQVVIENIAGAGGVAGVTRVAKAAADGYQFVLSAAGTFAHSPTFFKRLPYNPTSDFEPIGLIAEAPPILIARKDFPIATLTRDRTPVMSDLATAQEQGFDGFDAPGWYAFSAPKGTPNAIIRRLNKAMSDTLDTPAVGNRLRELGTIPVRAERRTPEYFASFIVSEIKKWAPPIKATGISMD